MANSTPYTSHTRNGRIGRAGGDASAESPSWNVSTALAIIPAQVYNTVDGGQGLVANEGPPRRDLKSMSSAKADRTSPPSEPEAPVQPRDRRDWLVVALLLAAVLAAYFPVLGLPFVWWDDQAILFRNPTLTPPTWSSVL